MIVPSKYVEVVGKSKKTTRQESLYPPAINTWAASPRNTPLNAHQAWAEAFTRTTLIMEEEVPQLTPVGEKTLPAKCKAQTVAYCPTMDLIALATEDEELRVFRLNGQRVLGGSFGGDPYLGEDEEDGEIRGMAWKGNGEWELTVSPGLTRA